MYLELLPMLYNVIHDVDDKHIFLYYWTHILNITKYMTHTYHTGYPSKKQIIRVE